jgi:protein-S-isoprenylcysteine O-methyltransferase Ste14
MIRLLQVFGWLACIVYATVPSFWLMVHPWADFWRGRRRSPYFALLPGWMGMWLVVGWITAPWRHVELYSARWSWILSLILFAIGVWLYVHSSKDFSARQLGGVPELLPGQTEQRLVTTGIRAHLRHPVYAAHLCEMLGWSLGTGLAVC